MTSGGHEHGGAKAVDAIGQIAVANARSSDGRDASHAVWAQHVRIDRREQLAYAADIGRDEIDRVCGLVR